MPQSCLASSTKERKKNSRSRNYKFQSTLMFVNPYHHNQKPKICRAYIYYIHILRDLVNHDVYGRIKRILNENHLPDHLHQCVMRKLETSAVGGDSLHLPATFGSNHTIKSSENYIHCGYRSCCNNYSKGVSDKHSLISHEYLAGFCYQCKNRVLWTDYANLTI